MDHAGFVSEFERVGYLRGDPGRCTVALAASARARGGAGRRGAGPELGRRGAVGLADRGTPFLAQLADHRVERPALNELHGVKVDTPLTADCVDRNDVRVVQLGGGVRFGLE